jgi:hypothetical protein
VLNRSTPGEPGSLHAPLLLLCWLMCFAAGAYVGLPAEIELILDFPQHPLVAASVPIALLMALAFGVWRLPRLKQVARPAAVGAVFGAIATGPSFLLGLQALGSF